VSGAAAVREQSGALAQRPKVLQSRKMKMSEHECFRQGTTAKLAGGKSDRQANTALTLSA